MIIGNRYKQVDDCTNTGCIRGNAVDPVAVASGENGIVKRGGRALPCTLYP
jgi:hypothetical protein